MRRLLFTVLFGLAAYGFWPTASLGQVAIGGRQTLDFDAPEAWAMKYFASVSIPSTFGSPPPLEAGEIDLGLEYVQIPSLDADQRRVGFGGAKVEDLNKVPYLFRPVARFGLGKKLTLSASYLPPVDRNGAEANIFALALGRPVHEGRNWRAGLRLHTQIGTVEGDFTCSEQTVAGGSDPERNPFGCEQVSRDEYDVRSIGLELSASWQLGEDGRWEPFAALSYNHMDLEFQVNAVFSGLVDHTRLITDGQTVYGVVGIGYHLSDRWRLAADVFYSPLDVVRPPSTSAETDELVNLRALLSYKIK